MAILVAPTEPAQLKAVADKVTLMPESWGVDVLILTPNGKVGVQRKEVGDLIGSLSDGRLAQQLSQMRCGGADWNVIVLEGEVKWTGDGVLIGQWHKNARGRPFVDADLWGVLWSLAAVEGVTVVRTGSVGETTRWVQATEKWWGKEAHKGLRARVVGGTGGRGGAWGRKVSVEWGVWVLQGWPGIGEGLARRIIEQFGRLPVKWDVTAEELAEVKGISLERARKWVEG